MIRCAFTMRLKPGALDEYRRHHDEVWPELVAEIEKSGIASITTFRNGDDLFLFSEIRDPGRLGPALAVGDPPQVGDGHGAADAPEAGPDRRLRRA